MHNAISRGQVIGLCSLFSPIHFTRISVNQLVKHEIRQGKRHIYLIVEDQSSGKNERYTVHKVQLFGMNETTVVGRELPLDLSRKVINDHENEV